MLLVIVNNFREDHFLEQGEENVEFPLKKRDRIFETKENKEQNQDLLVRKKEEEFPLRKSNRLRDGEEFYGTKENKEQSPDLLSKKKEEFPLRKSNRLRDGEEFENGNLKDGSKEFNDNNPSSKPKKRLSFNKYFYYQTKSNYFREDFDLDMAFDVISDE